MKQFLPATIALCLLAACSNIDDDERLIYVKPAAVSRAVLIEDFTGQLCLNCPYATNIIDSLIAAYGDTAVIAVGIHSGPLAFAGNKKYPVGLRTDIGDEYYSYWQIDHQPQGMVNRQGTSEYTDWQALVYTAIQQQAPLKLLAQAAYDEAERTLDISLQAIGTEGDTEGYMQVWLTEDSIEAVQIMPDGSYDTQYIHNHVFRDAVNGTWGETTSITEGDTTYFSYSYTVDEEWVAEHLSIVAFVYNGEGVQQVISLKIAD